MKGGVARFGFRKAVSVTLVFLVVTQLGGGRRSRGGDNMAPAGLKIKKFERGGKKN